MVKDFELFCQELNIIELPFVLSFIQEELRELDIIYFSKIFIRNKKVFVMKPNGEIICVVPKGEKNVFDFNYFWKDFRKQEGVAPKLVRFKTFDGWVEFTKRKQKKRFASKKLLKQVFG